jgi:cobalamin biosynthesis Co2+ chelatase CbiK
VIAQQLKEIERIFDNFQSDFTTITIDRKALAQTIRWRFRIHWLSHDNCKAKGKRLQSDHIPIEQQFKAIERRFENFQIEFKAISIDRKALAQRFQSDFIAIAQQFKATEMRLQGYYGAS